MPISIAEYLGQRTDVPFPDILPSVRGGAIVPTCPFSGGPCIKLEHNPPLQPVCSVRVHGKGFIGQPFIVCSNRLIPAQAKTLSPSHTAALASVAQTLFPGVHPGEVGFLRQIGVNLAPGRLVIDYILQINPTTQFTNGPRSIILEIQGGGETSNTGTITRYIDDWIKQSPPTNNFIAQPLTTSYLRKHLGQLNINVPGIIPNNAWKRQLEQILKKAYIARHFKGAFALVTGDVLHDYIKRSIPIENGYFSGWEVALIGISEVPSLLPGPIPITQVSKVAFMTLDTFVSALQNLDLPAQLPNPFQGTYTTLSNSSFTI